MDKWGIVHCHFITRGPEGKLLFWFNLVKHACEPHFWCNYSNPVPSQNIAELVFMLYVISHSLTWRTTYTYLYHVWTYLFTCIYIYVYTYKPIGAMTHSYGGIVEPNRWAGLFPSALGWSGSQLVWRKNEEYINTSMKYQEYVSLCGKCFETTWFFQIPWDFGVPNFQTQVAKNVYSWSWKSLVMKT